MQRRLLSNEMQDQNQNIMIDQLDALTQNKQVAEKYLRSSGCFLAFLNMHAMCQQTKIRPQTEIMEGRVRNAGKTTLLAIELRKLIALRKGSEGMSSQDGIEADTQRDEI